MAVLFLSETIAFARSNITTEIALDDNSNQEIRINFNISFSDLQCEFLSVDILDALGTNRQNVSKNVEKWQLDADGKRRIYAGRNREQREVRHEEHEQSLEQMHEDGIHAELYTAVTLPVFLKDHDLAFINFFAPWCVWCQRLHPTWEKLAEEVENDKMPIGVGSVDCVAEAALCREQKIMAFPTIRWFQGGESIQPDYKMDRTVAALKGFAQRKLEALERYKNWNEEEKERRKAVVLSRPENPGCQVSGFLMVNRVKGNFHIEAKSVSHNLNAAMTNLTHKVNHLSFGTPIDQTSTNIKRILKQVPEEYQEFSPMDGTEYTTYQFHQAYHHYIKVVSTHIDVGSSYGTITTYQFLEQSQIVKYNEEDVPDARFSYDLSPMSVVVKREGRKWYDYLTSLFAIIGGTFTTLGLIDASLYRFFKSKKL